LLHEPHELLFRQLAIAVPINAVEHQPERERQVTAGVVRRQFRPERELEILRHLRLLNLLIAVAVELEHVLPGHGLKPLRRRAGEAGGADEEQPIAGDRHADCLKGKSIHPPEVLAGPAVVGDQPARPRDDDLGLAVVVPEHGRGPAGGGEGPVGLPHGGAIGKIHGQQL
jgi:hypothetical protein